MFSYLNMTVVDFFQLFCIFFERYMCFLRHAFFSRVKETGCVVIGRAWEGVAMTHRPDGAGRFGGPDEPSQALTLGG